MLEFKTMAQAKKEFSQNTHLILSNAQAQKACKEYVKESVWAFNSNFLAQVTKLNKSLFDAIKDNNKCEDNNETILKLVNKFSSLNKITQEAISSDGRGHFLASYDGHETEIMIGKKVFFVYKNN